MQYHQCPVLFSVAEYVQYAECSVQVLVFLVGFYSLCDGESESDSDYEDYG